jgi:hypothetical protein
VTAAAAAVAVAVVVGGAVGGGGGGGGATDNAGTLGFTLAGYAVGEGAGSATIAVRRTGGDDGAVSVKWTSAAGTAGAADFTAGTGTLSWPNGNDSNKTFTVPIANDTAQEGAETILLTLSQPTGGATLDPARTTATLAIDDNDSGGGGGTPSAPGNLRMTSQEQDQVVLAWNDSSNNETGFRVERRTIDGTFAEAGTVGANVTTFTAGGLGPGEVHIFRVRANGSGGSSAFTSEVAASTAAAPGPCAAGAETLCINGDRFAVEVDWRANSGNGVGSAVDLPTAPDSGLFYFFSPSNLELLVKALDGCPVNNRYWVFFAATTNVELTLLVTDTQTGATKPYFNPLGNPAAPVQDTDAFPCG